MVLLVAVMAREVQQSLDFHIHGLRLVILRDAHLVWCLLEYIMVSATYIWTPDLESIHFNPSSLRKNKSNIVDKIFHYNLCIFIKLN